MPTKFLVAIIAIAAVISVASCHWFSSHNNDAAFNIEGKWMIDSIAGKQDSSWEINKMIWASVKKDSAKPVLEFNDDSTFFDFPKPDSIKHKYYVKEKELFLQEDSLFVPYQLNIVSDSLIYLAGKDSAFFSLKKQ